MNPRSVPLINAIGCLVLAAAVFTQWFQEIRTAGEIRQLRVELASSKTLAESETRRVAALERDIEVLKQSMEATRQAAMAERQRFSNSNAKQQVDEARDRIDNWQDSLEERDTRIRELEKDLVATRARLDEAVVRLRRAGFR